MSSLVAAVAVVPLLACARLLSHVNPIDAVQEFLSLGSGAGPRARGQAGRAFPMRQETPSAPGRKLVSDAWAPAISRNLLRGVCSAAACRRGQRHERDAGAASRSPQRAQGPHRPLAGIRTPLAVCLCAGGGRGVGCGQLFQGAGLVLAAGGGLSAVAASAWIN